MSVPILADLKVIFVFKRISMTENVKRADEEESDWILRRHNFECPMNVNAQPF